MLYLDGTILKGSGRDIYVVEGGRRRWVACCIAFEAKGYDWNNLIFISDKDLDAIPMGVPITSDETIPLWQEADRLIKNRLRNLKVNAA